MRVLAVPSDGSGCGWYRIGQPSKALMDLDCGISVEIVNGVPAFQNAAGDLVGIEPDFLGYDVAVIQRPMVKWQLQLIRILQEAGTAVVVEIDDDFESIHPQNTALRTVKPVHKAILKRCAEIADLVTVTTQSLADRYAKHGRYQVIPNYVSAELLDIASVQNSAQMGEANRQNSAAFEAPKSADSQNPVVGWSGTVGTHPNDLQAAMGGVGSAVAATNARFRVVGRPELVAQHLKLNVPTEVVPWVPIEDYPTELAKLDVGIAPIANTPFNRAKSWLKPLEMAAVGVPVVMSDVGEYRALAAAGIGILASSQTDWHGSVTALIQDPHFRAEQANLGRQAVLEYFLIEANSWKWADAWTDAVIYRNTTTKKAA